VKLDRRFLRNIAALQVGGVITSALNLASSFGLAHILGAREQGLWIVAMQLFSLTFFTINLGMLQVAVTQVAAACARGQGEKVAAWLAFLFKSHALMGAALFALACAVLPEAVVIWRRVNPDIPQAVAGWALWLCLTPLLDIPRVVVTAAFQGTRRMRRLAQVENAAEVLRTFLVVAGAVLTGSPLGPVLGYVVATLLSSLVAVGMYQRASADGASYPLPAFGVILRGIRGVPLRAGFGPSMRFGVMRQLDALGMKILPPLVIQTFGSSEWVAYFRIAQAIMLVPLMFMQGVSRTALPALAELRGLKDHRLFRQLFKRATLIGGGVITVGIFGALPFVPLLMRFMPPDYGKPVWILCLILCIGYVPAAFTITLDSFYLLTSRLNAGILISILGFVVSMPLSILFARELPHTGAAWGLVAMTLTAFVHFAYVWWYFRHDPELAA
jgi:O-antigen/teichoic acid export membrane protein